MKTKQIEERLMLIAEGLAIQSEIALLQLSLAVPDVSQMEADERSATMRPIMRLTNRLGGLTEQIRAASQVEAPEPAPTTWERFV